MAWHPECLRVDSPNFGYPRGTRGQLRANVQAVGGGGAFFHSTVGIWQAARDRFLNPAEEASAHFILRQVDVPLQMVDSADPAWHAGGELHDDPVPGGPGVGAVANLYFHGFEFEGGASGNYSEPLTENQKLWAVKLVHWLEADGLWPRASVYILRETLWEHNWVYSTACPSGRMPWQEMRERLAPAPPSPTPPEDDMTPEQDALLRQVAARSAAVDKMFEIVQWQRNIGGHEWRFVKDATSIYLLAYRVTDGTPPKVVPTRHGVPDNFTFFMLGGKPDFSNVVAWTPAQMNKVPRGADVPSMA